jgi:hypothetical protein
MPDKARSQLDSITISTTKEILASEMPPNEEKQE